jgi:hypothetical protein
MPSNADLTAVREALARKDIAALWGCAQSVDRDVRKAAKRALYLLRAQGLETAAVMPPAPPPNSTLAIGPSTQLEDCRIGAPDGAGQQLILIPRKENKGYRLFQVMTSDGEGITAFEHLDLSRRLLRQIVADLGGRGLEARPVPRQKALGLLAQAIRLAPERPTALQALRDLPELAEAIAVPARPVQETTDSGSRLADSARLFESPAVQGYLAEPEVLRETLARLQATSVSPLHLSEAQRGDQLKRVMQHAIEGYFDAPRRARYGNRLRGLADWFLAGGEEVQAGWAFAAAAQLESQESVLLNPFAHALFERAFAFPERAHDRSAEPSVAPLIIPPGSAR